MQDQEFTRITSVRYDSLDELFHREQYMIELMEMCLHEEGNKEYIKDTYISINNDDTFLLNIILDKTEDYD